VDEHVVSDQGVVTAAGPQDARAFAEALLRLVRSASQRAAPAVRARRTR
jgi:putative intracellular protease/amidase